MKFLLGLLIGLVAGAVLGIMVIVLVIMGYTADFEFAERRKEKSNE